MDCIKTEFREFDVSSQEQYETLLSEYPSGVLIAYYSYYDYDGFTEIEEYSEAYEDVVFNTQEEIYSEFTPEYIIKIAYKNGLTVHKAMQCVLSMYRWATDEWWIADVICKEYGRTKRNRTGLAEKFQKLEQKHRKERQRQK